MPVFAAFLRGVNVGRAGRIKMADLKQALAGQGFGQIETYLQSGNVVFYSSEPAAAVAAKNRSRFNRAICIFYPGGAAHCRRNANPCGCEAVY